MPPHCAETALTESGVPRACVMEANHDGDHLDWQGRTWESPGQVLDRLRAQWGATHRVVYLGRMWMATAHRRNVEWRTEIEPTPEQLEQRLRDHHGPPPGATAPTMKESRA